jgi:AraC-like DNA-binding protein
LDNYIARRLIMIGKTRQGADVPKSNFPFSAPPKIAQTCGDLANVPAADWRRHTRFAPPPELSDWIEHFWLESWRVKANATETRELLPHPCVQLAFAPDRSRIYGVQLGRFVREYTGDGRVFGIKFRPGAFYPFLHEPVSLIANTSIAAARVFPTAADAKDRIFGCRNDAGMVTMAAEFLLANLPPLDPEMKIARSIVETIIEDREVTRVHHLVSRFDTTERTLQRLFQRYVGASPRWVIKRYRAYEALDHLNDAQPLQLAALAQHLGYFDQAHFANDFKNNIGRAPSRYRSNHRPRHAGRRPEGT